MGISSGLQTEVFRLLLKGRRTVPELVHLIYGLDRSSQEFRTYYMRVWRSIRELEARGLVSAPLLGRDKTYRLTEHGLGFLLGILDKNGDHGILFSRVDYALLILTAIIGLLAYVSPRGGSLPVSLFLFLLGASAHRLARAIKEVW